MTRSTKDKRSRSQNKFNNDILAALPSLGCCSSKKEFEICRIENTHAPRLKPHFQSEKS